MDPKLQNLDDPTALKQPRGYDFHPQRRWSLVPKEEEGVEMQRNRKRKQRNLPLIGSTKKSAFSDDCFCI